MNIIKIEGISEAYPERVEGTIEWYFCKVSKDCFCDLYEAEEIVKSNNTFPGNARGIYVECQMGCTGKTDFYGVSALSDDLIFYQCFN